MLAISQIPKFIFLFCDTVTPTSVRTRQTAPSFSVRRTSSPSPFMETRPMVCCQYGTCVPAHTDPVPESPVLDASSFGSSTFSLPYPTWILTSTSSLMSTASRELSTAPSHNEEYCPMAINHTPTKTAPLRQTFSAKELCQVSDCSRWHLKCALKSCWRTSSRRSMFVA